jgi:membrane-bound lytic murein transglycosylase B
VVVAFALAVALQAPPQAAVRPSFAEFLAGVRTEALSRGIRAEILDQALATIEEPVPVVLERDRAQAESILPLEKYIARILKPKLIANGREAFAANRPLLDEIGAGYGVDPRIIVAVWGMESNFGRFSGVRPTIAALATLAWDPRRSTFFRGELLKALEILNRGDIDLPAMRGSWAGAMGQVQFMPSSYLLFAEDYDGDGRRDIWSTPADVFASIANYLLGHGWTTGEPWGREVKVSREAAKKIAAGVDHRAGTCQATRDMTVAMPAKRWAALGIRTMAGSPLPPGTPDAALVSGSARHFLVYRNYDALLEYNCAHSYALSVALLADRVASAPKPKSAAPRKKPKA